jgi:hypothetical protein
LVTQDAEGRALAVDSNFAWIARQPHISNRSDAFKMILEKNR